MREDYESQLKELRWQNNELEQQKDQIISSYQIKTDKLAADIQAIQQKSSEQDRANLVPPSFERFHGVPMGDMPFGGFCEA